MSSDLYRKYIDIISENSQESSILTEGVMNKITDVIKAKVVPQVEKMLGNKLEDVKAAVLKATGGDTSLSIDNIKKAGSVLKNMGMEKFLAQQEQLNEGVFDKAALAAVTALSTFLMGWSAPLIVLTISILLMIA